MMTSIDSSPFDLELTRLQRKKLGRLLKDTAANVEFYRENIAFSGNVALLDPNQFSRLPVVSKSDFLAAPSANLLNQRFDAGRLFKESTTGSTGQPFSMYLDRRYIYRRNLRFLRGLYDTGYRPWQTLMLLTDRHTLLRRKRMNWYYVPVEQSTESMLVAYNRIRPRVLYGFLTPLRLLAGEIRRHKRTLHRPACVVSTAEMLDPISRRDLEEVFGCPVCDFYGLTEMGLVAWQRPGSSVYVMSPNSTLVEFLPGSDNGNPYRLIMTNLELRSTPIVRYDCGDLAHVRDDRGRPIVERFEGRQIDTLIRKDGSELSPYRVTDSLRDVPGIRRFKVTQHDIDDVEVALELETTDRDAVVSRIREILKVCLGNSVRVEFAFPEKLVADGTVKFRPIECCVRRR